LFKCSMPAGSIKPSSSMNLTRIYAVLMAFDSRVRFKQYGDTFTD
jgi:hypothetical protein